MARVFLTSKSPIRTLCSNGAKGILNLVPSSADILSLLIREVGDLINLFHFSSLLLEQSDQEIHAAFVNGFDCTSGDLDEFFE